VERTEKFEQLRENDSLEDIRTDGRTLVSGFKKYET
jgi:hypothetical protein